MLVIDGSYKSGGGQTLRTSLGLSVLTQKPFSIKNIRKGRSNPGLKEQHLQTTRSIANLCNAKVTGDKLGSTELTFIPNKIKLNRLEVNISTAGSTALALQSLLIPGIEHNLEIHIKGGGTWNLLAPSIPYLQYVILPLLKKMNYDIKIEIKKHGFYPKGGAELIIKTKKTNLKPLQLQERGKLNNIRCFSYASNFLKKRQVAERQSETAKKILKKYDISIVNKYVDSYCPGSGILLIAEYENTFLGYDVVGEKGKTSEIVGQEVAHGFLKQINSKSTVDEFMSDQILPYLALAKEKSQIKIPELTQHAETNIWLIKQFLDVNFRLKGNLIYVNP